MIPNEEKIFYDYLSGIHTLDSPRQISRLEVLTLAMRSEWNYSGDKQRHVIMFFSNKEANPINNHDKMHLLDDKKRKLSVNMNDMHRDLEELINEWESDRQRRLFLFAPYVFPWSYIEEEMFQVASYHIAGNQGRKRN